MPEPASIKKISLDQLKIGMYIHDLNCSWIDHPFATNRFLVKDGKRLQAIKALGVRELYIDTGMGLDVADAPTREQVRDEIEQRMEAIANEGVEEPMRVPLAQEIGRARKLHGEANHIVRGMRGHTHGQANRTGEDRARGGKMVDSIFRNQDALLPLARLKQHDNYTFQHSVSVCALMVSFARELGLDRAIIKEIAIGALLHDGAGQGARGYP